MFFSLSSSYHILYWKATLCLALLGSRPESRRWRAEGRKEVRLSLGPTVEPPSPWSAPACTGFSSFAPFNLLFLLSFSLSVLFSSVFLCHSRSQLGGSGSGAENNSGSGFWSWKDPKISSNQKPPLQRAAPKKLGCGRLSVCMRVCVQARVRLRVRARCINLLCVNRLSLTSDLHI